MGLRTVNDPFGGTDPLVDKMIGNAYNTVRHVALNMAQIKHVSENLESIHDLAQIKDAVVAVAGQLAEIEAIHEKLGELEDRIAVLEGA